MLEAVEGNIHQRLCALLDEHQARYRVMAHDAVGQCEAVSAIRGTALGQGAKALVCKVKGTASTRMCWRSSPPISRPISPAWPDISAAAKPRWPVRRKWMPSPPACSAPFPPSASIRRCGWWPTRCCLSAFHKSPLTPDAWIGRSFSIPRIIYISPDRRSRPFAALANRASALIFAAWRENPVYSRHDA